MLRPTLAVLLLVAPAAHAGEGWTRRTVPGHAVSVELPGEAVHKQKERSTMVGSVVSDTLVSKDASGWCAATVSVPPSLAVRLASDHKLLTSARDNLLDDYDAAQESWTSVTRDGHSGMRLVFATSRDPSRPERGVAEIFSYDGKIVTVVTLRAASAGTASAERMFASVDL